MENAFDNGKIAVAIRTARAAAGWNQQEFADLMKVAKSTVARIETLEIAAKGDFVMRAMRLFRENGIDVDLMSASDLPLRISDRAIAASVDAIKDETNRRSDRKTGIAALLPNEPE
jgi:transcriptional regulator with XRE-family HTH domain